MPLWNKGEDNEDEAADDYEGEEELEVEEQILYHLLAIICFAAIIPILSRIPRSRGKNIPYHAAFLASAAALLLLVPDDIQNVIFSPGGVLIVGTLIPIYESIVAVCTIDESDDVCWLQYWLVHGAFTYSTEFMDIIAEHSTFVAEHWYELEFFFTLWLLLPFTDGGTLFYDKVTEPYISPATKKLKEQLEGWAGLVMAVVNSGYLWILWMTFLTLPEEARRFVVVAVGTVYPLVASTVAITTESTIKDDAFWLTYWSCFSILFICMDYLETFVGGIRGFYSICLCATVYLFLPMFNGAEVVFRRVLVPMSGQYENMLLRDAYLVRLDMERKIPESMHERVFSKAADVFKKGQKKEE